GLPHDPPLANADQNDAVTEVVVDCDQVARDPQRERRMIELAPTGGRPVAPDDAAVSSHDQRVTRPRVIRDQDPGATDRLRIRGVRDRRAHSPSQSSIRPDVVHPRAVDLAHEHPAVRQRRGAVDRSEVAWRTVTAYAGRPITTHDSMR